MNDSNTIFLLLLDITIYIYFDFHEHLFCKSHTVGSLRV